jgi:type VI secretion system protein ImpG
MRDELLEYYERELTYLRRLGAEFAKKYPRVASGLQLEPTRSEDPHVERLLEGFAFLAARVHLKVDDEFPDVARSILATVYPEYVRPVPAISLVQLQLDPEQAKVTTGHNVSADTLLYSKSIAGVQCRFRTCFDTTLWPIQVSEAAFVEPQALNPPIRGTDSVAALRILLRTPADVPFSKLGVNTLRFYLNAEPNVAAALYELLSSNAVKIVARGAGKNAAAVALPADALRPVGFEPNEGVLPLPRRSHAGFRLLTEYFAFPEKFWFFDLRGLERLSAASFGDTAEIVMLISRFERAERRNLLEGAVRADTIALGCTPIINLFPLTSEPVLLAQRRHEYQLVADARRRDAVGIYEVQEVNAVTAARAAPVRFAPLYGFRQGVDSGDQLHYWHATRRPRGWRGDDASDVFLSFVDSNAVASHPDVDSVTARLLCYNADLPSRLQIGDPEGDFEMPGGGAVSRISALVNPTPLIPSPSDSILLWRLVSVLSLNLVSLVDGGARTLQEILHLHNLRNSPAGDKQIQAITGLSSEPAYARISGDHGLAFARGLRVNLDLDEDQFAGGGAYLFASVLERFLGMYTSLNSFNTLRVKTRQRKEILRDSPPRSGWRPLV